MPTLVVCRCDPQWLAIAACETCLARDRELHRLEAAEARASSLVLDARDYADRQRDRADAWRMEWER